MADKRISPFKSVKLSPDEAERLALTLSDIQNTFIEVAEHPDFPHVCLQQGYETETQYAQFLVFIFLPPLYRNILNTARVFYPDKSQWIEADPQKRRQFKMEGHGEACHLYDKMTAIAHVNNWYERVRAFDQFKQRKIIETIAGVLADAPLRAFVTLVNALEDKYAVNRIRAAAELLNRTGYPAQSEKMVTLNHLSNKPAAELSDEELKAEIVKRMASRLEESNEIKVQLPLKPVEITTEAIKADLEVDDDEEKFPPTKFEQ
jgi:hypothetical protein